jgi:hypothetical protein
VNGGDRTIGFNPFLWTPNVPSPASAARNSSKMRGADTPGVLELLGGWGTMGKGAGNRRVGAELG